MVSVGGALYYTAADSSGVRSSWPSDGTAAGTTIVAPFPAHRELEDQGHTHVAGDRKEETVPTPGGTKESRRPDITTIGP